MELKDYRHWFVNIVKDMYPKRDAGLVILITAFPLLERYIREKADILPTENFLKKGGEALFKIFPELLSTDNAEKFWKIFRHGLLHQVTFFSRDIRGIALPGSCVTHDIPVVINVEADGVFVLHPVLFAKRVLDLIESDFEMFRGKKKRSTDSLPTERTRKVPGPVPLSYPGTYRGTYGGS